MTSVEMNDFNFLIIFFEKTGTQNNTDIIHALVFREHDFIFSTN